MPPSASSVRSMSGPSALPRGARSLLLAVLLSSGITLGPGAAPAGAQPGGVTIRAGGEEATVVADQIQQVGGATDLLIAVGDVEIIRGATRVLADRVELRNRDTGQAVAQGKVVFYDGPDRLAGYEAKFIAFADEINGGMPRYVVQLATDALNDRAKAVKGSRILALGVAYKAGVGDIRDSPALEIIEALLARGAQLDYADPRVPQIQVGGQVLKSVGWKQADLSAYDLVVLLTAHPEFDPARLVQEAQLLLDTRNATGALGDFRHVIRI